MDKAEMTVMSCYFISYADVNQLNKKNLLHIFTLMRQKSLLTPSQTCQHV